MNVLIVGCQRVGQHLVSLLEKLGHDVSVLDSNPANIEALSTMHPPFTGMAVAGVPIDVDVLRSAGIESCDAVAAVTRDDTTNLMVSQIARDIFHVSKVITRLADPATKNIYATHFGMRTVCSTNLTANALLSRLLEDDADEQSVSFGSSTALFSTVPASDEMAGHLALEITPPREGMLVFGLLHANGLMELMTPSLRISEGDRIIYSELAD